MPNKLQQLGKVRARKGFTLVELLISMAIFVSFLGVVTTSYVSIVRAQRDANDVRKMYSELRNVIDVVSDSIRESAVDYGCYNPAEQSGIDLYDPNRCLENAVSPIVGGQTTVLALVKKDGLEKTIFKIDGAKLVQKRWQKTSVGWEAVPGYEEYVPLNTDLLSLEGVNFRIFPQVNPYSNDPKVFGNSAFQFQPKVGLFLLVKNGVNAKSDFQLRYQTTISTRVYNRSDS